MSGSVLTWIGCLAFGLIASWAIDRALRWHVLWRFKRDFAKIRSGNASPGRPPEVEIATDTVGVVVRNIRKPPNPLSAAWSDIVRVLAFKRDYLTVDCICIAVFVKDGFCIEVNEEMAGWDAFTRRLPDHLPGSLRWEDWFSRVAFPPFATNETEIFAKAAVESQ